MPDRNNTRNPEPFELIGSTDLRQSFKDHDRLRGSWFINGIEMHQFDANSPASVVSQINAKTGAHFVTAEIDDGGHLVLIDNSGSPIQVSAGAAYVDPPPASTGDVAGDVLRKLQHAQEHQNRESKGNKILELLGLDGHAAKSEEQQSAATARPGFETGRSAEDRAKARQQAAGNAPGPLANPNQPADRNAAIDRRGAPQIPSNPTPGNLSGAQGKLDDGRGRTGTGGGQGETSAATIQNQHSGANSKPAPVPGA